ncbi:hypothetical protein ACIPEN_04160 [Herbaspirillum chlorophenolicum]|uniref:Uncharacterized protein n=1 Tax=Herbaspirillum chlorophenolicum TaxID=211589 RepID=A0ABW8EVY5_9BURK
MSGQVTFIMQEVGADVKNFRTIVLIRGGLLEPKLQSLCKAAIFHDEKFSFRIVKNAGAEHQKHFSFPEISFRIAKNEK